MIKKIFYLLAFTFFTSSCGFKIVEDTKFKNFDIVSIETIGDNRINYILENSLKDNLSSSEKKIKLNLITKRIKEIKERNIRNEITKYSITIQTKINYFLENSDKEGKFEVSKSGNFNLANQYSQSITNEKKLIEYLSLQIQKEIINNLNIILNDI